MELEAKIASDANFKVIFQFVVFIWEYKYNGEELGLDLRVADTLPFEIDLKVSIETSTMLSTGLNLGILWPEKVLKLHSVTYEKGEFTTLEHAGEFYTGLLRCPSFGEPIGTIKATQVALNGFRKLHIAEDSTKAVRGVDQVGETFERLQKSARLSASTCASGAGVVKAKEKIIAENDDEDPLSMAWVTIINSKGSKVNNAAAGAKPKRERDPSCLAKRSRLASEGDKQKKDIQVSEEAVLKAQHLISSIKSGDMSVTITRLNSTVATLEARLADKYLAAYAHNYDGETTTPGIKVLDNLRCAKESKAMRGRASQTHLQVGGV